MDANPLNSISSYSEFIVELLQHAAVQHSTLIVWPESPWTGRAEGEVFFIKGLRLRMREEIDFDAELIVSYGYEVYRGTEKLYWYDDFPHPHDPSLAVTMPHHKHVPPDIKHHRIPAHNMSFSQPNLPFLIEEIAALLSESP